MKRALFRSKDFWKKTKSLKYKNISCYCDLGHIHDSRKEAHYCDTLLLLKKAGEIRDFDKEKKWELKLYDKHICDHYPDFTIHKKDGTIEVHEVKGFKTDLWALKKKIFEACYPRVKYVVIY